MFGNSVLFYESLTPAGYYHNVDTGQLEETNLQHGIAAFEGIDMGQPNGQTEWQPIREKFGPQITNGPYGIGAQNPFVGVGIHPVAEVGPNDLTWNGYGSRV